MKTNIATTLIALTVGLSALHAQSNTAPTSGRQTRSTQRAKPEVPFVVAALDANHDGIIDAAEINKASEALKGLDKNADGKLTVPELRRPRPSRPASPATKPRAMQKRPSAARTEAERRN